MARYVYRREIYKEGAIGVNERFNLLGEQGWEMCGMYSVQITPDENDFTMVQPTGEPGPTDAYPFSQRVYIEPYVEITAWFKKRVWWWQSHD